MSADLPKKALRYRWFPFWILAVGYGLVFFHRLSPAVVAVDMMRDLQVGGALIGFLSSAYFYSYAVMQLPGGLLTDSWGPRRVVAVFSLLAFVGSVLLGLAPSVSWAIVGRVLVGLGVSLVFVPALKIQADWFRPREFSRLTAILMAVGGLGSLSAAAPLAMLSSAIGWRMSFVAVGFLSLVLAAVVWLVVRDRPSDLGWPPIAGPGKEDLPTIPLAEGLRQVLTDIPFWTYSIWYFFAGAVLFGFGGLWGGPYLQHVHGLSKDQAGQILSMVAVGMIAGSSILSFVSGRLAHVRKRVIIGATGLAVCLTAALAFLTGEIPPAAVYFICFGYGIVSSVSVVFGYTMAKELFPIQIAGTATGIVNIFPFAGAAVSQPVLGYILESYGKVEGAFTLAGYRAAFLGLFVCAVAGFLTSTRLREKRPSE